MKNTLKYLEEIARGSAGLVKRVILPLGIAGAGLLSSSFVTDYYNLLRSERIELNLNGAEFQTRLNPSDDVEIHFEKPKEEETYTPKKVKAKWGDTVSGIAKNSGVSVGDFLSANPHLFNNPNHIKVGDVFTIPEVPLTKQAIENMPAKEFQKALNERKLEGVLKILGSRLGEYAIGQERIENLKALLPYINQSARGYPSVTPDLIAAVIGIETGGVNGCSSFQNDFYGAHCGVGQLSVREFSDINPFNKAENVRRTVKTLSELIGEFQDVELAFLAYNVGKNKIKRLIEKVRGEKRNPKYIVTADDLINLRDRNVGKNLLPETGRQYIERFREFFPKVNEEFPYDFASNTLSRPPLPKSSPKPNYIAATTSEEIRASALRGLKEYFRKP